MCSCCSTRDFLAMLRGRIFLHQSSFPNHKPSLRPSWTHFFSRPDDGRWHATPREQRTELKQQQVQCARLLLHQQRTELSSPRITKQAFICDTNFNHAPTSWPPVAKVHHVIYDGPVHVRRLLAPACSSADRGAS